MAKGDLFDFGDPFDAQRRDLDGKFIDGPKPGKILDHPAGGGLFDMPKPAKPQGIEALGSSVHTWGKPIGTSSGNPQHGVGTLIALIVLVCLVVAAVLMFRDRDLSLPTSGPTTTHVYPGGDGRYIQP